MELIIGVLIVTVFVCFLANFVLNKINIYAQNIHTHIERLYYRTNELQKSVSKLEQRKQSEIRANYNMDFTHINTDI